MAGVAQILEERGFAGIWVAEHLVAFPKYDPAFPYPYTDDGTPPELNSHIGMIEPLSALTFLAGCSKTLRLGTGMAILPQRNPVYFAKVGTAIDLLSNGRFIAGVGLGWSGQEYVAAGTPFEHRGSRMRDYIQVVRSLWADELSKFEGKFYNLPECRQLPRPIQRPHPPFFFGGESKPAMRRVAEFGQGWYGLKLTPDTLAPKLTELSDMMAEYGRSLSDIEIAASPYEVPCDKAMLEGYARLGVDEVVILCFANSLDDFRQQADRIAREVVEPAQLL
jgi:probable F420-dependent oxidoreductase